MPAQGSRAKQEAPEGDKGEGKGETAADMGRIVAHSGGSLYPSDDRSNARYDRASMLIHRACAMHVFRKNLLLHLRPMKKLCYSRGLNGSVAQLVEQRIENPRVGSSILPQATTIQRPTVLSWAFSFVFPT